MDRTSLGSWFHALGAATRNARSPNRSLVRGMNRLTVNDTIVYYML